MLLSEAALSLCILLLICTSAAQVIAVRNGDTRRLHGLRLAKLGISLSACAYLLQILGAAPGSLYSLLILLFRTAGIVLLWLAWKEHRKLQREQLEAQARVSVQEKDAGPEFSAALPPGYAALYSGLNSPAREAVCAAQEEALRQRRCCVDTDHLLLGLLRVRHCTASRILEHSHISADKLVSELVQQTQVCGEAKEGQEKEKPGQPAFTPRARQVLVMAEMEAHRFDKSFVGTEHLLLGLLLIGTGPAASTLFEAGMTVDGLRREVLAAGK